MPDTTAPIIIKKKKGGHAGHHGGAWKVAYADFVTAMMSLFIVLWLMSSTTKQEQQVIAGYFRDPNGRAVIKGSDRNGTGENVLLKKQDMTKLKEVLQQQIHHVDNLDKLKKQIEMTITPEGLRIELMEDAHGTFFETGSSQPTPILVAILKVLSQQIGTLPNRISIEGHTDAQPYSNDKVYSNWELSAARAMNVLLLLTDDAHCDPARFSMEAFGPYRPVASNQSADGRRRNRRVDLVVIGSASARTGSR